MCFLSLCASNQSIELVYKYKMEDAILTVHLMEEKNLFCSCHKLHSALVHNLLWFEVLYTFSFSNISIHKTAHLL